MIFRLLTLYQLQIYNPYSQIQHLTISNNDWNRIFKKNIKQDIYRRAQLVLLGCLGWKLLKNGDISNIAPKSSLNTIFFFHFSSFSLWPDSLIEAKSLRKYRTTKMKSQWRLAEVIRDCDAKHSHSSTKIPLHPAH